MAETATNTQGVKDVADFGEGATGSAKRWKTELEIAKKARDKFFTKAERTVRRYLDERDAANSTERRMNILWSNIQTLSPAVYSRPPKPETARRFDSANQVSRVAAIIMERNLEYLIAEHSLYDTVMKACVFDRLLSGQGTAWVRYEAQLPPAPPAAPPADPNAAPAQPQLPGMPPGSVQPQGAPPLAPSVPQTPVDPNANASVTEDQYAIPTGEKVCYDYVHWKDFSCSVARTWEEVTWVGRRVYMTRDEGTKRFGNVFKDVPLNYKPTKGDTPDSKEFGPGQAALSKAVVWEIWSKTDLKVYWVADDYDKTLDEKDDIFKLPDFFPCPKPLLATTTTDSLVPVPDFVMYQDQAYELDQLTNRISLITQAVKIVGVYDKTQASLQRMLTEGVDNTMIPVDNWAMFAERGGIKGTMDFLPVDEVMSVLTQLIQARATIKQDIYEITGLADIIRGASVASETATAQNIKAKFANIRIGDLQRDIARFASDLVNMTAHLITNFFQPETLILNADIDMTAQPPNPDAQYVPQAVQLIKSGQLVKHKIFVSVDSITDPDDEEEKQARVDFLQATGMFFQQAFPTVKEMPQLGPMMAQMVLWGVRGFKAGRDLEGSIEQGIATMMNTPPPPKQPSPAEQKAQADLQQAQQQHGIDMAKKQDELEFTKAKHQEEIQFIRDRNRAEVEGILLKANVSADAQQNAIIAKATTQAAADFVQLQQGDAAHQADLQRAEESHQQGIQQGAEQAAQQQAVQGQQAAQQAAQQDATHQQGLGQDAEAAAQKLALQQQAAAQQPPEPPEGQGA